MDTKMIREKKPLVSVIVPVYRVEAYLEKCVLSILGQDMKDFELILVDDGSPDVSGAICDRFAREDKRVRTVRKEYGGVSDARNAGIEAARGEYLAFVDADDYVEPTYLSYLLALMHKAPGCRVCQANHCVERNGKTLPEHPVEDTIVLSVRDAFESVLYHDRVDVSVWGKLYERSVFDNLRFPKGKLYEDTYLFGNILLETPIYVYGGQPQYHYVQRKNSIVNQGLTDYTIQFVEAAERLTDIARRSFPDLDAACLRRLTHARLSVLRYMDHCPEKYIAQRDNLRQEVLRSATAVCANEKTPRRDKLAIRLLQLGYGPFYTSWKIYNLLR